eukprot:TRINITY_DN9493_c0_g1_i1.p1 TRINITY_DN9493_c0_g1~~TRINITY_DN9493_c0_g1_i1.p1  ORF type:complete len:418 (+),score=89.51 TRINITY_DN9493_c0_g1_i1:47-1255(+)
MHPETEPYAAPNLPSSDDDVMLLESSPQSEDDTPMYHGRYKPHVTNPIHCLNENPEGGKADKLPKVDTRTNSKVTKEFYEGQNEAIDSFIAMDQIREKVRQGLLDESEDEGKFVTIGVRGSLIANILILAAKVFVVVNSGSVAFLASLLDSVLDLISGMTLVITNKLVNDNNLHKYPLGKKTFEPLGTLVFSACMFTASFQLLKYAIDVLVNSSESVTISLFDILFICGIILVKAGLFVYCNKYKAASPSLGALASDHRNDIISNSFGLGAAYAAVRVWMPIDPIAAIVITLYIMHTWAVTGYEQIMTLSGRSAPPEVIRKLTWTARHHHPAILFVDTVRAVALGGDGYQVEVDIVLPPEMPLRESHDIGESLQIVLEAIDDVSRAYVHIDYEFQHNPWDHR